jgi:voltage-gated potassium channel
LLKYVQEAQMLLLALAKESRPLLVFLFFVCVMLLVCSSVIYVVEADSTGFASIPECLWWSAVTITTVGYGDVVPQSVLGRFLASILMLSGYGLLAVPTIVGYGMRADAPSDDNGDQQGGADTQGFQMDSWSDRGVRKEECQHFTLGHPFPESLSFSKPQSDADGRDAYVYFIHLSTRCRGLPYFS